MASSVWASIALGSVVLTIAASFYQSKNKKHPPGPPGILVFGNALAWPKAEPWRAFFVWSKQYGDVLYATVFTRRIVIISSTTTVQELLNKRAGTYSHRPYLYTFDIADRMLSVFNISTAHPRFRQYRKLMHGELGPRAANNFPELLRRQTILMLQRMAREPTDFMYWIRMNTVSTVLRLAYGYDAMERDDPMVASVDRGAGLNTQATAIWLEDYYPILRKLPMWLPYKHRAVEFGQRIKELGEKPTQWFREQFAQNKYKDCFTSRQYLAAGGEMSAEQQDIVKDAAIGIYAGGVDTVASALTTFILLMSLHPEVQKKAQAELDKVLGRDRLANETDVGRADLPYLAAVIKEVLRWGPPVPLGLPHCANVDDEYRGFHIEKGTFMIANIWGMMHDEAVYPDPFTFKPERHLDPGAPTDPTAFVFGFGKRACAGEHFARIQLFTNVAALLSTFSISEALNVQGQEVEPRIVWRTSTVSRLEPFECRMKLRGDCGHLLDGPAIW